MRHLTFIFIFMVSISPLSFSKIIYAPCDSIPTIQKGIDFCSLGDTLIIYPGTYHEKLRLGRYSSERTPGVTVGSLFLITGDRQFIENTIIDASNNGSCLTLDGSVNALHAFVGLTLQNGSSKLDQAMAGGVVAFESYILLSHMIIQNHDSGRFASAIYCGSEAGVKIENSIITKNAGNVLVTALGGGIFLTNTIVADNIGSVMRLGEYSGTIIINSTITNNGEGIKYANGCDTIILNSILWNPNTPEIKYGGDPTNLLPASVSVSNTCIQEGKNGVLAPRQDFIKLLQTIQSENPLFIDSNGGDYSLKANSPCIGAGADSMLMNRRMIRAPKQDFFGKDRPSPPHSKVDLGAIEHSSSTKISQDLNQRSVKSFNIFYNYPNPFNESTNIIFSSAQEQHVEATIIDMNGRVVKKLFSGPMQAGLHTFIWNSKGHASGIYLIRLQAYKNIRILKVTVLN